MSIVSVIIVNWKSASYLRSCLKSLESSSLGLELEIIVVDNASYDGCKQLIDAEFPSVLFVQSTTNLGFSGANNLGFKHSSGDFLLFLNPDTEVYAGAVETMVHYLVHHPQVGITGCRLLNSDGSIQVSCVQPFPTILNQIFDLAILQKAERLQSNTPQSVEAISGACIMIRREVFQKVKFFSTDYFMYSEDLDLCYKVKHKGYMNMYLPQAIVVHHGGRSTDQAPRSAFALTMMRESVLIFITKFRGPLHGKVYRLAMFLSSAIRLALLIIAAPLTISLPKWRTASRSAMFKWYHIGRWSLGLEKWVKEHRQQPIFRTLTAQVESEAMD